jgi:UDP-N-acetylmuramyl pentapeptide phosphotransferase/UDP-N-acetylglucosamine-1-phosphate transferase
MWLFDFVVAVLAGLVAGAGTRALIPLLRRRALFDRPNERSLHDSPTPRGGGIAVIATVIAAWALFAALGETAPSTVIVAAAAAGLAVLSWIDDLGGLPAWLRLLAHLAAALAGLLALPQTPVFQGWLPLALDRAAAALLWLWFTNLFNFMDGMDGLAGSEAASIAFGLALLAGSGIAPLAAVIFGAAIGFLVWNWAPARIFLGDVGSVPLGYLLGFLLLAAAAEGYWAAALILPLYFLADATLTLSRRLLRGERVWQAHREHFYQRAVQTGLSHDAVAWRVALANAALIACAMLAERAAPIAALALAALIVALLLTSLARARATQ